MIAFVTFCPYVADLRHFVLFEWSSFERLLLVAVVVAVEVVLAVAVVPSKTRMHSGRMRTARTLTGGGGG